ncbi:MAG: hypothetical protein EOR72_32225 [Mesorhizobium sp.]|uniref:hypothetical protein n=1 Tax=Mesorhizobium sp. TaxID=1871066 RepID=UPI000FE666FE|nr:hypothetical protein [Mesorhizobium sp.]RWM06063.1 MAG: hypothetical protein EOR72_32225 [Mesorhizobium sp.]
MIVILQRSGDFLEAFGKDAEAVSKVLGTTLLTRGDVPMTGIALEAVEEAIAALGAAGLKPHLVDRDEGRKAVWRRTHPDFRGTVEGKRSVMVFRCECPTLVQLDADQARRDRAALPEKRAVKSEKGKIGCETGSWITLGAGKGGDRWLCNSGPMIPGTISSTPH